MASIRLSRSQMKGATGGDVPPDGQGSKTRLFEELIHGRIRVEVPVGNPFDCLFEDSVGGSPFE